MEQNIKKIFFLISVSLFLISCGGKKVEKFVAASDCPDQVIKNFKTDRYELDKITWSFSADKCDVYEKKNNIDANNVIINFYENGKKSSVISADRAHMQTDSGNIKAEGNVVVYSLLENTTIYTETLNYFEKTGKVTSNSFVREEKSDLTITGVGLEANADLSDILILSDIKVVKK